ncbi:tetratricopeptide repeat protein [Virgibacillus sediminis]|uniref:GTP-binding protein n=1 Tax=Virgibacillus sediminis TaxID=202260 RepID=A0ABV7A1Q9_9BACI
MTLENLLIRKYYYSTFLEDNEQHHPIKVLSEKYMDEQQNEMSDFSNIRFAQGEVYYLNNDFEAAIFKWENVSNELKPWAQKNIADAHYKLNLLAIAEEYYKAVETDSSVLKTEVLLQLFTLYIQRSNLELAAESIKNAVKLNPGYPDVTDMARSFFEERGNWDDAVELAINESIRTESLYWFETLESYVAKGHAADREPDFFKEVLIAVYHVEQDYFEKLVESLWNSYSQTNKFFLWLREINHFFLQLKPENDRIWRKLPALYEETYFDLIDGKYLIRDLFPLMPSHLINWVKLSASGESLAASSALLAWSGIFPSNIDSSITEEAESLVLKSSPYQEGMEDALRLFESIKKWAQEQGSLLDERYRWMVQELVDSDRFHLMLIGENANENLTVVRELAEKDVREITSALLIKDGEETEIHAVSDRDVKTFSTIDDTEMEELDEEVFFHWNKPAPFLRDNNLSVLTAPEKELSSYLSMADGLLFSFNADQPLSEEVLAKTAKIREQEPDLPICFALVNGYSNLQDEEHMESVSGRIHTYFPDSLVINFQKNEGGVGLYNGLSKFIHSARYNRNIEKKRTKSILDYVKKSINQLRAQRLELEKNLIVNVKDNKEMVTKLEGAQRQLGDMEDKKIQDIKNSYQSIREKLRARMERNIPEILRNCAQYIKEDSNFETVQEELNIEMNKQITNYFEETALRDFRSSIEQWLEESEEQLVESQSYLDEMKESFNQLFGEERLKLHCDMQVLDDWRRDIDRMTSGSIKLENNDLISQPGSSQFLLKGAGRLFDSLPQYKGVLYNRYKQYIETRDYSQAAESVTEMFIQQLELFGKSLDRDIHLFFAGPSKELQNALKETHNKIEDGETALNNMRKNPENYQDPLTLFELKLRQFGWMNMVEKPVHEYP